MKPEDIKRVAVIGAGTMGAGFGLCFARAGIEARLFDISQEQLQLGEARIDKALGLLVEQKMVSPKQAAGIPGLISTFRDRTVALQGVQFVLEAVPEDLTLKQRLFAEVEEEVAEDTVLASNTSALFISEIASLCQRPHLVCGMHWWNPPEFVPLVEVIKGRRTSPATARLVYDLAKKLDREPIMVQKEVPGFVGNRLQMALFREALHIVAEGVADPRDVDRAVKYALGFRWAFIGPLETADLGNLDTWSRVANYLFPFLANDSKAPAELREMVDRGHLGVSSGQGFYTYSQEEADEVVRKRDLYFLRAHELAKEINQG